MSITIFDVVSSEQSPDELRWQNPDHLICPGCAEAVRPEPPTFWTVTAGPVPQWSHVDGEALCPAISADGHRPAEPIVATW